MICAAPWDDLKLLFSTHRETLQRNQASYQGAVGDSSVVSAFSEACGVAGVSDDDESDNVLFAAAYVPSAPHPESSELSNSVADHESKTAATPG